LKIPAPRPLRFLLATVEVFESGDVIGIAAYVCTSPAFAGCYLVEPPLSSVGDLLAAFKFDGPREVDARLVGLIQGGRLRFRKIAAAVLPPQRQPLLQQQQQQQQQQQRGQGGDELYMASAQAQAQAQAPAAAPSLGADGLPKKPKPSLEGRLLELSFEADAEEELAWADEEEDEEEKKKNGRGGEEDPFKIEVEW
jgi:hypothetical protein